MVGGLLPLFWMLASVVVVVLAIAVNVSFAIAVYADAQSLPRRVFVSAEVWALACLLGGILAVLAYWIVHHSTLRQVALDPRQSP